MNKDRLQAIIDRIEADAKARCAGINLNRISIETLAQIDSGCKPNIFNARRDARIWLDLSNKQAGYLFSSFRTLAGIKNFIERHGGYDYKFGKDGYDREGYDRAGFNRDGYDFDGLDKHNKPKVEQV